MINWKDIGVRAVKTFIQTAVSYIVLNLSGVDFFNGSLDETFWIGLALSAGAAGASAVWNGVLSPVFKVTQPPIAGDTK